MSNDPQSLRSPLARARGLGSAKSGAESWINLRLLALALVPLSLYVVIGFVNHAVIGGYSGAIYWLQSAVSATAAILFLLAGLMHGAMGMREVVEDYVQCHAAKILTIFAVNFICAALAVIGTLSVAKIYFGV
jgi:succinate dehydrogenase / fumarate reductase membrane anchor subunit